MKWVNESYLLSNSTNIGGAFFVSTQCLPYFLLSGGRSRNPMMTQRFVLKAKCIQFNDVKHTPRTPNNGYGMDCLLPTRISVKTNILSACSREETC